MIHTLFTMLVFFQVKHFVFDFMYQPPWQYLNKGKFLHPGGIVHSLQHVIPTFTFISLITYQVDLAIGLAAIEFVVHYLVDWSKVQINTATGWKPNTTDNFWRLLGLDQLLHQLTYIGIIYAVIN